ncbi:hypothetical protein [Bacillus sp. B1-b2]|uniref:hypothetical protein n=1 Tax=Bacillus sp. B1-b2 TaxID=2653201 RepID=UPI0012618778|nr:hypothetical protein [Bacillus sp. B1-b2]KAB7668057.1 hypothetical protein F9279_14075 [Bacillus sp. B1-b2]
MSVVSGSGDFLSLISLFFGSLFYLVPIVLIIIAVVKFYKLMKEKNEILKEISRKLDDRLDKK